MRVLIALLLSTTLVSARAAPHNGIQTCKGEVEVSTGVYHIDDCTFDGTSKVGKQILKVCGDPALPPIAEDTSYFCTVKAWGEFAPDFYIKRVITISPSPEGDGPLGP